MVQLHSALVTVENVALPNLRLSWSTARFSDDDGIAPMDSLHQAGDSVVGVARATDTGFMLVGSGVMVGPGLLLTATHVLDEFPPSGAPPLFLTFLPGGARAWLASEVVTTSGSSVFAEDRKVTSDLTLVSCTLNSDAHSNNPLMLAPLQVALPLVGERLWAFGYRHGEFDGNTVAVTPLVSSGLVTAAFPHGRGERMPAACVEVAMETWGGMSGGPVANAQGYVVGIVSSSFEGGPSYVTLIWDVLRLSIRSTLPWVARRGRINLLAAKDLGLARLKGDLKRYRRGDVVIRMTEAEMQLLVASTDPSLIHERNPALNDDQLGAFEEKWSWEMEKAAAAAAIEHLEHLSIPSVCRFLQAEEIPLNCLNAIQSFSVEDFEGVEDFEVISNAKGDGNWIAFSCGFDLLSVIWTVKVPAVEYLHAAAEFCKHFLSIKINDGAATMQLIQRCYFEAELNFDQSSEEFTGTSISLTAVHRHRRGGPTSN